MREFPLYVIVPGEDCWLVARHLATGLDVPIYSPMPQEYSDIAEAERFVRAALAVEDGRSPAFRYVQ